MDVTESFKNSLEQWMIRRMMRGPCSLVIDFNSKYKEAFVWGKLYM